MGYAKRLPRVGGSLFWLSAVFPLPDNAAPLRLPCVRGGGFAPAKPEGLFRAAKRGTYIYFCVCRQPLSHGKAATAPLAQGSRGENPPAILAPAGLHRGAGEQTHPRRSNNPRASGLHRWGGIRRQGNHLFRCGAPVRRTALKAAHLMPPLCKGRRVCASKAGGVVSCRQTGDVHIFLRLPSTPQSA